MLGTYSGGLGCKEWGYKRRGTSQKKGVNFFLKKQKNKEENSALFVVKLEPNINIRD